jgi:hypothetical protein
VVLTLTLICNLKVTLKVSVRVKVRIRVTLLPDDISSTITDQVS